MDLISFAFNFYSMTKEAILPVDLIIKLSNKRKSVVFNARNDE